MLADMDDAEWQARLELAACYRIFDHLGWVEMIFNHITLRVPGEDGHLLINRSACCTTRSPPPTW